MTTLVSFVVALVALLGAATAATDASVFTRGIYTDPNHPDCPRYVLPHTEGGVVDYYYTNGADNVNGEGASCKNQVPPTLVLWGPLPTTITETSITIDFSSKGGPADLHGSWQAPSAEDPQCYQGSCGIKWDDGNFWPQVNIP